MHGENKTLFIYYVIVSKRAEFLSNHRVQSSCWKGAYVLLALLFHAETLSLWSMKWKFQYFPSKQIKFQNLLSNALACKLNVLQAIDKLYQVTQSESTSLWSETWCCARLLETFNDLLNPTNDSLGNRRCAENLKVLDIRTTSIIAL